jgi:DNA-binding transcriptional ArsR family regulator
VIELRLTAAALGTTRFGVCPLGEMAHSLQVLSGRRGTNLAWRRWARSRTDGVDLDLLELLMPVGRWVPDMLFPLTDGPDTDVRDQLDALARVPARDARDQLERVWEGHPLPDRLGVLLDDGTLCRVVAAELDRYWQQVMAPHWPRLRGALERDVTERVAVALARGLSALFEDLHPEVSFDDGVLRVDKPLHETVTAGVDRLRLVPSAFVAPSLGLMFVEPRTFEITYPARHLEAIWEHVDPRPLRYDVSPLLGRTRAGLLAALTVPMSTTHLAAELGQSPATVSGHLAVLRDCGMVRSWRSGRSVLYLRTALGADVVTGDGARALPAG